MRRRIALVPLLFAAFAVAGAACNGASPEGQLDREFSERFGAEIESDVEAPGDDLPMDGVEPLMAEFAAILPDPNTVVSVNVTERNITVAVQQIEDPALADDYTFILGQGFRGPLPAPSTPNDPLETLVFNLAEVDWSQVPAMSRTALEAAVPDSEISNITAKKSDGVLGIRVFTTDPSGNGFSDFTSTGELIATSS